MSPFRISVGDRVEFSKPMSEQDLRTFAAASGDTNRLHLDDASPSQTRLGRRIVHGTLVSEVINAALARFPGVPISLDNVYRHSMTIDELTAFGMDEMTDGEIESFLLSQSTGTLALPTETDPYVVPMSYGYDGGSRLYFYFLAGDGSRKVELATQAESASFLVYSAETAFNWRSVRLAGTIRELPESSRGDIEGTAAPTWRPELFEAASESLETRIYEFRTEQRTGVRHTGLPQGFYS